MTRNVFILVGVVLAMSACGRASKVPARIPQASDSLYTAQAAMKIYGTQPEQALAIVDSALVIGNISPFRADFLRALVYANSVERPQLNKAISLCENLLKQDSTQVVDKPTFDNRNNVLGVMLDACRKKEDDENWLRYAVERAELSRAHGMETEALRMEAEIGAALTRLGRREEGLIKLEQVIRALDQGAPSIDRMDAGIVARKRRILVFEEVGRFRDMIPDAQAIIQKLEAYKSQPSAYARDSFRLPNEKSMAPYCDFYTAQARSYLARAYSQMNPPDLAAVQENVRLFEGSDYGKTYSGRTMIAPAWKSLGQWDKLLAIDEEVERRMGEDTLNTAYLGILKDRADMARARGHYPQAFSYLDRYTRLQGQLNDKRFQSEALEYAARYHAMEQEQKLRETENESARKDAIIVIIVVALLIITAFAIYAVSRRHAIMQKNRALARMIGELSKARGGPQADAPKPDRELFDLIDRTIRRERLYTNVNLQRQDIVDRFDISRHTLNDLFSAYADGQSFTAYINGMRMQDAIRFLQKEPDTPIGVIAEAVGLTPANFRELFKHQFGMTPTEYRQNL
jgi:AraC-like DNA-binding protein